MISPKKTSSPFPSQQQIEASENFTLKEPDKAHHLCNYVATGELRLSELYIKEKAELDDFIVQLGSSRLKRFFQ
ncbi:hypothetical protein HLI_06705 [Halobacillus litoralis]|uniref:Uncharacterized protein n=1 Tax=Halobacillus litoralis TaxID=45668 RepID=A0A410MB71_9BACI|nr:hypothetical protein HLI_06705 [Halobacillus litoralis]